MPFRVLFLNFVAMFSESFLLPPRGEMAVSEKRLFWISIIVVELVALYIVWRPYRDRFTRPSHRIAVTAPVARPPETKLPAVVRLPETKPPAIVIASRKPWKATRPDAPVTAKRLVVNASLKAPEPIPAAPALVPRTSVNSAESFWCDLATIGSPCDCKVKGDERANNVLQ